jgi:hypothetical protein
MGYYLEAFICKKADSNLLTDRFEEAIAVELGQGLALIPMTEALFDQINEYSVSDSIDKFTYMDDHVEQKVLDAIGDTKFAYVEAEYFGGTGGQIAVTWNNNKREQILPFGQDQINAVLKSFGVIANKGQDEFQTLGLGRFRHTKDWIDSEE